MECGRLGGGKRGRQINGKTYRVKSVASLHSSYLGGNGGDIDSGDGDRYFLNITFRQSFTPVVFSIYNIIYIRYYSNGIFIQVQTYVYNIRSSFKKHRARPTLQKKEEITPCFNAIKIISRDQFR